MCRDYKIKNLSLYKDKMLKLSQKVVPRYFRDLHLFGLIKPFQESNAYIKFLLL